MSSLSNKRSLILFGAVALLLLMQIAWWTTVFLQDVDTIAALKSRDATLAATTIGEEAFHRRVMFLSESITFGVLACFGLYLLYGALAAERRSRVIQRNFIEVVTHESKTPLTALKLRLEDIQSRLKDPDQISSLHLALDEVRRLTSTFERALSLNRMERQVLTFEVLPIQEVVRGVLKRLEPLFRSRKVRVTTDFCDGGGDIHVRADLFGLQNSVQSLLENAIFYNPSEDRAVNIVVKKESSRVRLLIEDNGPGIPKEEWSRIFERFYRVRGASRVPGTGLGLYLARTILEAHQESLQLLESAQGARFEINLPAVSA